MRNFKSIAFAAALSALSIGAACAQAVTNVPCNQLPAITGDVTRPAGSCASTLAAGSASNLNSGTLAVARGGTGDTGTAWAAYTPSISCGGGTTTGSVPTGFFKTIGKTTFVRLILTTSTTTCTSATLGLPNTSQGGVTLMGREDLVNGAAFMCQTGASGATCPVLGMTGSGSSALNNARYTFLGVYDSQ